MQYHEHAYARRVKHLVPCKHVPEAFVADLPAHAQKLPKEHERHRLAVKAAHFVVRLQLLQALALKAQCRSCRSATALTSRTGASLCMRLVPLTGAATTPVLLCITATLITSCILLFRLILCFLLQICTSMGMGDGRMTTRVSAVRCDQARSSLLILSCETSNVPVTSHDFNGTAPFPPAAAHTFHIQIICAVKSDWDVSPCLRIVGWQQQNGVTIARVVVPLVDGAVRIQHQEAHAAVFTRQLIADVHRRAAVDQHHGAQLLQDARRLRQDAWVGGMRMT